MKVVHFSRKLLIIEDGSFFELNNFRWKKISYTLDKNLDKITLEIKNLFQPLQVIEHRLSEIEDVFLEIESYNDFYGERIVFKLTSGNDLPLTTSFSSPVEPVRNLREQIETFLQYT